jgi:cysteine desulfurase/selenocysteine lyase
MVAVVYVSNSLGTINPVKEMIEIAHGRGVPVLVDGAQAVPHLRVDVQELDCDFFVFSGHKVYGPTGIGALYGKAKWLEAMPPWQGGGDMIASVSFDQTTYNVPPYKFEAGTPHVAGAVALGVALDYVRSIGLDAITSHDRDLLDHATRLVSEIPGVRIIGQAPQRTAVLSFVVEEPAIAPLDVGVRLDLEGVAVRTGHHCCQPVMDRLGIPGTARASFGMYNTCEEVEVFAEALRNIVLGDSGKARTRLSMKALPCEPAYPAAAAASPEAAGEEIVDLFEFLEDWTDRYQHIIELGERLPVMPPELKSEENRVRGCQSTVYLHARRQPGSQDILEFLADSDAAIVRGELAILQRLFSGQKAGQVLGFDVDQFFGRLGLNQHLTMGRRNGLASMVQRIRNFAATLAGEKPAC